MIVLHRDNEIYQIPTDLNKQSTLLHKFYHKKFIDLFESKNISYKLIDYENYDGEFYIGRFAHALQDKKVHSLCFDKLYNHYGEKMWPNKKSYYYYDDKVRQYELLKKFDIHAPSVVCNNVKGLIQTSPLNKVVKSTYGAGSESSFFMWKPEHLKDIQKFISECYNWEDFFPCLVQEYIEVEYEYQIFISDNQLYGFKQKTNTSFEEPNSFPHIKNVTKKHWVGRGEKPLVKDIKPTDFSDEFIQKLITIQKELNTPNIKFDIMDNKVLEFSYIYGATFPITYKTKHNYYDLLDGKWKEKPISLNEWAYKQQTSVLKHLGII